LKPVKYFTSATFDNDGFSTILNNIGIKARPVADGVILDLLAFNAIKPAILPHWVFLNRDDINSPFHTRPASLEELTLERS
jgi:hypothetical protein